MGERKASNEMGVVEMINEQLDCLRAQAEACGQRPGYAEQACQIATTIVELLEKRITYTDAGA